MKFISAVQANVEFYVSSGQRLFVTKGDVTRLVLMPSVAAKRAPYKELPCEVDNVFLYSVFVQGNDSGGHVTSIWNPIILFWPFNTPSESNYFQHNTETQPTICHQRQWVCFLCIQYFDQLLQRGQDWFCWKAFRAAGWCYTGNYLPRFQIKSRSGSRTVKKWVPHLGACFFFPLKVFVLCWFTAVASKFRSHEDHALTVCCPHRP